MSKFLQVKGFSGLVRDKGSGAILNVNENEIAQAIESKQNRRKKEATYERRRKRRRRKRT